MKHGLITALTGYLFGAVLLVPAQSYADSIYELDGKTFFRLTNRETGSTLISSADATGEARRIESDTTQLVIDLAFDVRKP
jgi:hypothetical protein